MFIFWGQLAGRKWANCSWQSGREFAVLWLTWDLIPFCQEQHPVWFALDHTFLFRARCQKAAESFFSGGVSDKERGSRDKGTYPFSCHFLGMPDLKLCIISHMTKEIWAEPALAALPWRKARVGMNLASSIAPKPWFEEEELLLGQGQAETQNCFSCGCPRQDSLAVLIICSSFVWTWGFRTFLFSCLRQLN